MCVYICSKNRARFARPLVLPQLPSPEPEMLQCTSKEFKDRSNSPAPSKRKAAAQSKSLPQNHQMCNHPAKAACVTFIEARAAKTAPPTLENQEMLNMNES